MIMTNMRRFDNYVITNENMRDDEELGMALKIFQGLVKFKIEGAILFGIAGDVGNALHNKILGPGMFVLKPNPEGKWISWEWINGRV